MCNCKKEMLTKAEHDILDNGFNGLKDNAFIQFVKGKDEHGGSLENKPCYYFKKPELIDLLVYELFDEQQRNWCIEQLKRILRGEIPPMEWHDLIRDVVNKLETGNIEGKTYNE